MHSKYQVNIVSKLKIVYFFPFSIEEMKSFMKDQVDLSKIDLVQVPPNASEEESCEAVREADVILCGATSLSVPITRKIIEAAKNLKLIQVGTTGYDTIDVVAATEKRIPVANTAGTNAPGVAEHTILLILGLLRRLIYRHQQTLKGNWPSFEERESIHELRGKTLGLFGLGAIGREVSKLAKAFGALTLYYKRNRLPEDVETQLGVKYVPFDELLVTSDILSINVPLTEETRGMIGKAELAKMKDMAILVNTARAEIVDEKALAEALQNGTLAGAGIDVFAEEPVDARNPLLEVQNVILTPHMGGDGPATTIRTSKLINENINRVLEGQQLLNLVNQV